ncbi:hypothetical protein OG440_38850 (plasmid) [Streptomyces sp. NBC_00637]|uniref:hypothetical protein n=1 Tax=Streptomyces sp. NBC_00637 TaxID=2903667 RepID=UPI003249D933
MVRLLWDAEMAQQQKEAAPSPEAAGKPEPRTWNQVFKERPWARAAHRLERGTLPAIGWVIRYAVPREGSRKERGEHIVLAVFVVLGAGTAIPAMPQVGMPVVVGTFLWKAWELGAASSGDKGPGGSADEAASATPQDQLLGEDGEQPEHSPLPLDDWLPLYVEYSVALSYRLGRKGIHLVDLLQAAQEKHDRLLGWDVSRLRADCERLGIPVNKKGINIRNKNTIGVRYDELEKALGRTPRMPPSMVLALTPQTPHEGTPPEGP